MQSDINKDIKNEFEREEGSIKGEQMSIDND